jgi:hypothetical protein
VYETLLFLHVLAAFMLMSAVAMLCALALGAPVPARVASIGNLLWDIGGLGTLVFGIWIVAREEAYEITDGWILAALGLWLVLGGTSGIARKELTEDGHYTSRGVVVHWLRAALVIGFLALMIWKPGV